jgi:hypothetical protein
MSYFAKIPIISYGNTFARNLLTRVALGPDLTRYSQNFYPYQTKEIDRPDVLAYNYYDDADSDWLIFLTNNIIDPYFGYRLNDEDFNAFIKQKYGSIANAETQICYYRNDWESDDQTITTAAFDAKTDEEKFYWVAVLGQADQVIGYERKREDIKVSTNYVIELSVESANGDFTIGERVTANSSTAGVVCFSNSSFVTVKHIEGSFATVPVTITGGQSNATAVVNTATTIQRNIPASVEVYFSPVSYYEYEVKKNDDLKKIKLLDNRYKTQVEKRFGTLLKE